MPEQHLKSLQQAFPPQRLSFLLAIVVALTPFAVDMYLPAMPAMATYFATGIEQIEISMPLFLLGFALGQIVGGPVSDNYGRKPIGIAGFSLFTLASVFILYAPTVESLWILRFVQAFGGGFGAVIAAAIVRDLYDGKDSARIFTLIGPIGIIGPNNMASYLHCFSKNSATANAVMGTSQFALGAVIGTLVSLMHTGSLLPLFSIMFVCTLVASLALRISPEVTWSAGSE